MLWEVLEIDIQHMKRVSATGNRYLLMIVDRATKFLLYPPLTKSAESLVRELVKLCLTFGVPLFIRSDGGGEFTAEVVNHVWE